MKRYTIYRKLFAFNAGSWEAIKEHRGESPEADKQYEAYKRKYGKEINEHEAGRSNRTNNRSTNTSDSTRRENSSYKSSNNQRTNTSSNNRKNSWEDSWEEFKKGFDERNRKYREQRQQTEENFKKWDERSSARAEEMKRKAENAQKRWDEHVKQERATRENLKNKWKATAEGSARKTSSSAFEKEARKRASRNGKIGLGVMAGLGLAGLGAASYILDREEEKSKKKKRRI